MKLWFGNDIGLRQISPACGAEYDSPALQRWVGAVVEPESVDHRIYLDID
jgi:hypothetical protein